MKQGRYRVLRVLGCGTVAALISTSALAGTPHDEGKSAGMEHEQSATEGSQERSSAPSQESNKASELAASEEPEPSTVERDRSASVDSQQGAAANQPDSARSRNDIDPAEIQRVFGADFQQTASLDAMTSVTVRELQTELKQKGYYQGEVDGIVGPKTRAALARALNEQHRVSLQMLQAGDIPPSLMRSLEVSQSQGSSMNRGALDQPSDAPPQGKPSTDVFPKSEGASSSEDTQ